jgi:cytochrome oxidase assembly protein ShyY1
VAIVAFVGLGRWQWGRGETRQAQWNEFEQGTSEPRELGSLGLSGIERFQHVAVTGEFDGQHQFLLDNRIQHGRAGYEVLTPFQLSGGRVVLVDRGWLPGSGYRDRLPDISLKLAGLRRITGRVDELPAAGLAEGRAAPLHDAHWPKVTSFPTSAELSAALGRAVEPRILLLDASQPGGYLREWTPPGLPPSRHFGYAIQWWAFALAAFVLWIVMGLRRRP